MTRKRLGRATAWICAGQFGFAVMLATCVGILPGIALKRSEVGISNYGVHAPTVVPYTLAFLATAAGSFGARHALGPTDDARVLRATLTAYGVAVSAVLASTYPYTLDRVLRDVHVLIGAMAYVVIVVTTIAVVRDGRRSPTFAVSFLTVAVGTVISAVTIVGTWHLLFIGQVVTFVGFSGVLVVAVRAHDRAVAPS